MSMVNPSAPLAEKGAEVRAATDYISVQQHIGIPDVPDPRSRLTAKQVQVKKLQLEGHNAKQIARIIGTSRANVYKHLRRYRRNVTCAEMTSEEAWQVGV